MKTLILTDEDFYTSPTGQTIRGGHKRLYDADLVIHMKDDGDFDILKDRRQLTKDEVRNIINFDDRILLAL
jgi:hypothetical protein